MDLDRAFQILEVDSGASLAEIKRAYRELAAIWHPDRHGQNPHLYERSLEKMKDLNAAYDCIRLHFSPRQPERKDEEQARTEPVIATCPYCGTKNRIIYTYDSRNIIKCGKCGHNLFAYATPGAGDEWAERSLCGDGECIGTIGPDGRCNVCGKTLAEGREADEYKTRVNDKAVEEEILRARKRKVRSYVTAGIVVTLIALSMILLDYLNEISNRKSREAAEAQKLLESLLDRRLPNGTIIRSGDLAGNGELTIKNGLSSDAVVKLINVATDICIAFFYVTATSNFTLKNIDDGDCRLLFCTGRDWDQKRELFTRESSFSDFNKTLHFETTKEFRGRQVNTQYSSIEVTLHPVQGGNVRTQRILNTTFARY